MCDGEGAPTTFRRLRLLFIAVLFALLGAVAGRAVGEIRRQQAADETPHLDLDRMNLRPQDVIPGVVAAMRVTGRPWSLLHVPPWLAAFGVNFAIAAFASELGPLRRMARGELGPDDTEPDSGLEVPVGQAPAWTASTPQPATTESAEPPASEEPPATSEPGPGSGSTAFSQ